MKKLLLVLILSFFSAQSFAASCPYGTELVKSVGGVIDNLHTSKEEKLAAELKIKELISNYEIEMEKQITSRWEYDMKYGSELARNIRPLVVLNFTLLIDFLLISSQYGRPLGEAYLPLLMTMGITVIGGYFTLREYGKTKQK